MVVSLRNCGIITSQANNSKELFAKRPRHFYPACTETVRTLYHYPVLLAQNYGESIPLQIPKRICGCGILIDSQFDYDETGSTTGAALLRRAEQEAQYGTEKQ